MPDNQVSNETSEGFIRVADVSEMKDGKGRGVWVNGVKVALFKRRDEYIAFADRCPHMGASLSDGRLTPGAIQCHWHGWKFDTRTGECEQKPWACIPIYDVRVDGSDILLRPPRPAADTQTGDEDEEAWMAWDPEQPKKS